MFRSMTRSKHRCGAFAAFLSAILACAPAAQASQTTYRVPSLRQHGPAAVSTMPDILRAARQNRLPRLKPNVTQTLSYPYGVAVGPTGVIYVTQLFGGVNVYSTTHKLIGSITNGVSFPSAVALSFSGDIYVANNGGNNVTIYNPSFTLIGAISDTTLASPTSMYVDRDDTVWVLDQSGSLHSYLNDGTVLTTTHTGGYVVGPWGPNVTVWGIANAYGSYDEVFENRAQAVHDGPNLYNDFVGGSPYAAGEAEDAYGQQYVSDLGHNQIQIWSANGAGEVGVISTPAGPYGVAVDSANKRLYVAMTTLNEVYVYSTLAPYKQLSIIH